MSLEDYYQFTEDFVAQATAAFNAVRDNLIAAGVPSNNISITVPDTNNLRVMMTVTRQGRTVNAYFELQATNTEGGEDNDVVVLYIEGNGSEITHTYVVGTPIKAFANTAALYPKLTNASQTLTGEGLVKLRAFLRL